MDDKLFYSSLKSSLKDKLIKNLLKDEDFKDLNIEDLIIQKVEENLNGEIDFTDKSKIKKESKSGIMRPRLDHVEIDGWKIIPINRFKILSKYVEKINTSIRFQCNDGAIVEYCPRYAYNHNEKFRKWFDEKKANDSGIKYDSGTNKIGELPIKWFDLIEGKDYFINKTPDYSVWKD